MQCNAIKYNAMLSLVVEWVWPWPNHGSSLRLSIIYKGGTNDHRQFWGSGGSRVKVLVC